MRRKNKISEIKGLLKLGNSNWFIIKTPPDFEVFNSTKRDLCPYDVFYDWVFQNIEKQPWMTVSDICLTQSDCARLDNITKSWLKKLHKLSGKFLSTSFAFISLERSPGETPDKFDEFEDGFVYIRKRCVQ